MTFPRLYNYASSYSLAVLPMPYSFLVLLPLLWALGGLHFLTCHFPKPRLKADFVLKPPLPIMCHTDAGFLDPCSPPSFVCEYPAWMGSDNSQLTIAEYNESYTRRALQVILLKCRSHTEFQL